MGSEHVPSYNASAGAQRCPVRAGRSYHPGRGPGVSPSPPSLAREESQRDDSQNKAALPLPWLESETQRPVRVPRLSVRLPGAGGAGVGVASWLQQHSPPASAREGASESRAREHAGQGLMMRTGALPSKVSLLSAGISLLIGCQSLLFPRVLFYTIQLNVSFWLVIVGGKMYCLPLNVFLKGEQSQSFVLFLFHPGS